MQYVKAILPLITGSVSQTDNKPKQSGNIQNWTITTQSEWSPEAPEATKTTVTIAGSSFVDYQLTAMYN